jgi:hypothetical protein
MTVVAELKMLPKNKHSILLLKKAELIEALTK